MAQETIRYVHSVVSPRNLYFEHPRRFLTPTSRPRFEPASSIASLAAPHNRFDASYPKCTIVIDEYRTMRLEIREPSGSGPDRPGKRNSATSTGYKLSNSRDRTPTSFYATGLVSSDHCTLIEILH